MKIEETASFSSLKNGRRIYTVSQLNRQVRMLLESKFPAVWVEGEISNFKHHTSGHMYLTLKDETAQIQAAFFSQYQRGLQFEIRDGLKVLAFCRVAIYEARGQYQLYIERIEPKGVGALQLAFQQLKERLGKEGLFREERKRAIPKFPKTVGVITSPTGAAIHDILNVVNRRFCGTHLLFCPVKVQGEGAAEEIARAIENINRHGEADVLIVGRGGGSLEDLWAFNEEAVARAVYQSSIPVISAVGHETDWTICDFVADLRAPTPSAAAELVVMNRLDLERQIASLGDRIRHVALNRAETLRTKLEDLMESSAFRQPRYLLEQWTERLDELRRQAEGRLKGLLSLKTQMFHTAAGRLHALSPLAILKRGYSVTFDAEGRAVTDAGRLTEGQEIRTKLYRGTVLSKILKMSEREGKIK